MPASEVPLPLIVASISVGAVDQMFVGKLRQLAGQQALDAHTGIKKDDLAVFPGGRAERDAAVQLAAGDACMQRVQHQRTIFQHAFALDVDEFYRRRAQAADIEIHLAVNQ